MDPVQVNMLTSSKGTVLRCDVNGKIVMKVFLSGMPDVKLGLNDKLEVCGRRCKPASIRCAAQKQYMLQCDMVCVVPSVPEYLQLWRLHSRSIPEDSDQHFCHKSGCGAFACFLNYTGKEVPKIAASQVSGY